MAFLLILSERQEDIEFGRKLAKASGMKAGAVKNSTDLRNTLATYPKAIVLWNVDDEQFYSETSQIIPKYTTAQRTFVVTENPIHTYPHLLQYPVFGHHLLRRYQDPATEIYARMIAASQEIEMFGMKRYFPDQVKTQTIVITKTAHKRAAVDALQNSLTKQGIMGRMSSLVAQATDEIIMNAIFDAPIGMNQKRLKHDLPRETEITLGQNERVEVSIASTENYMGVCVTDYFGSLKKETLIRSLFEAYDTKGGSVALGLQGAMQAGLSLLFIVQANVKTEVITLFPRSESFKEFRAGFRFLSLVMNK